MLWCLVTFALYLTCKSRAGNRIAALLSRLSRCDPPPIVEEALLNQTQEENYLSWGEKQRGRAGLPSSLGEPEGDEAREPR